MKLLGKKMRPNPRAQRCCKARAGAERPRSTRTATTKRPPTSQPYSSLLGPLPGFPPLRGGTPGDAKRRAARGSLGAWWVSGGRGERARTEA